MTIQIYTATGCVRCKITKQFMKNNGIGYEEFDFKADGKDAFSKFYRANRKDIFRDKDGVEFPVFTDGKVIRQGVSVIIGYLVAGDGLSGFIGRSLLHGEWIDGFQISGGDPSRTDDLLSVLAHLKKNGLKIQMTTDGRNASVLQSVNEKRLADRVIMEVRGPVDLYQPPIGEDELKQSMALTVKFPDYRFITTVGPVERAEGEITYLAPEEVGEAARLIEEATGSKKNPYVLARFDPGKAENKAFKNIDMLPDSAMFKYRTAARRYQVMTEIEK